SSPMSCGPTSAVTTSSRRSGSSRPGTGASAPPASATGPSPAECDRDPVPPDVTLSRDEGIVLRTHKLGEADRIVVLLTAGRGKVRAVAKGVRKTKSRIGGGLRPPRRGRPLLFEGG